MTMPADTSSRPARDRRRAARGRCLREAHCFFNKGYSDLNVLVRNISATGAKLTGDELFCLPEEFDLQMANSQGALTIRRVKRMWRRADSVGVEFLEPERELPSHPSAPPAAGVR